MRKARVWVVTVVLISIFSTQISLAAVTPGVKCSKLGAVATTGGKKYTCVKSGKKLAWNKGVALPKPTPKVTPTAIGDPAGAIGGTPTPTAQLPVAGDPPLKSENCGYGNFYYRMNNGVIERSFYPDKLFTPSDTRTNLDFDPIRVKAYETIRAHLSAAQVAPQIDFHISPNFPIDVLNPLKQQLKAVTEFWSDRFQVGSHMQATFLTEKDTELIDAANTLNSVDAKWVMDTYLNPNNFGMTKCGWRSGIAGAHVLADGKNSGQVGYWIVFPTSNSSRDWDPVNLPHEFTHSIQGLIWNSNGVMGHRDEWVAYNFTEGGAQTFGTALAFPNIGWYNDEINRKIMDNFLGGPTAAKVIPTTTAEIILMLQTSEKNDNAAGSTWAYTVGFHLWEWLIANYGFDSYWNIAKGISSTQNYDATVLKVIGKTRSELYIEAAPYILKQFRLALKN
ncbi:MAG: hypothetical protein F2690_03065 [Actinobacteria bacterium]|uniref:Unannotated protein n=1 Tax=freshwater metagenome TaxID=449393 RepID=A0A6J6RYG0_9ZZZZ|nr:hypothetical protein [Actinomycetota bacterium]MSX71359.1 hypothetical protein [Actinomycetota bacterium]MSY69531.1 hypothetical protein [Actinomycetota bacterium]MTA75392.1 hypothetical protein [Actinomycetota bacterium]